MIFLNSTKGGAIMKEKMIRAFSYVFFPSILVLTYPASARDSFGNHSSDGNGARPGRGGAAAASSAPVTQAAQPQPQSFARPSAPAYSAPPASVRSSDFAPRVHSADVSRSYYQAPAVISGSPAQTPAIARSSGYSSAPVQPRVPSPPMVRQPASGTYPPAPDATSRYRSPQNWQPYGVTRGATAAQPAARSTATYAPGVPSGFSRASGQTAPTEAPASIPQTARAPATAYPAAGPVNAGNPARVSSPITRRADANPASAPSAFPSVSAPRAFPASPAEPRAQNTKPNAPVQAATHVSFSRQNDLGIHSRFLANSGQTGPKPTAAAPSRNRAAVRAETPAFGTAFNRDGGSVDRFGRAIRPQEAFPVRRDDRTGRTSFDSPSRRHDDRFGDRHTGRHDDHGFYRDRSGFFFSYGAPCYYSPFYATGIGFTWYGRHAGFSLFVDTFAPAYYAPFYGSTWYSGYYGSPVCYSGGWCSSYSYVHTPRPIVYSSYYTFEQPAVVTPAEPVYYEPSAAAQPSPTYCEPAAPAAAETQAAPAQTADGIAASAASATAVPPVPSAETAFALPAAAALTLSDSAAAGAPAAAIPQTVAAPAETNAPACATAASADIPSQPTLEDALLEDELQSDRSSSDVRLHVSSYAEGLSAETFWASYTGNDRDDSENADWSGSRALADTPRQPVP